MPKVLIDSTAYIDLEKANKHRSQPWAIATLRHAIQYSATYGHPYISAVSVAEVLRGLWRDINPRKAEVFRQEVTNDFHVLDFDLPISFLAGVIDAGV